MVVQHERQLSNGTTITNPSLSEANPPPLPMHNHLKLLPSVCRIMALLLFAGCSLSVCAQQRKVQNKPFIDERRFHYGFTVGLHDQGLSLTNNGFIDPATGAQWVTANDRHNFGFSVGVLGASAVPHREATDRCIHRTTQKGNTSDRFLKVTSPSPLKAFLPPSLCVLYSLRT